MIQCKLKEREKVMPEIWDLLDENGNKTGKVMQKGEPIPEGFFHKGADIWMINSQGKILLQKRSPKKRLSPNVWAMTGGSVIKGETSLQTIERETLEELGIQLNMQEVEWIRMFKTEEVWLDEFIVKQEIDLKDIVMQETEVCDVKWVSFEEAEAIFEKGQFLENRWEFVRDLIKERLEK